VARLHRVIGQFPNYNGYWNNNRPTQPLNGRVIRLRHGGQHHYGDRETSHSGQPLGR
jgi:hypothetical protein